MMTIFTNVSDGKDIDIQDMKSKEYAKYDKLSKEYELLKDKYDTVVKELSDEKEKKKTQSNAKTDDKNTDLQNSERTFGNLICFIKLSITHSFEYFSKEKAR